MYEYYFEVRTPGDAVRIGHIVAEDDDQARLRARQRYPLAVTIKVCQVAEVQKP